MLAFLALAIPLTTVAQIHFDPSIRSDAAQFSVRVPQKPAQGPASGTLAPSDSTLKLILDGRDVFEDKTVFVEGRCCRSDIRKYWNQLRFMVAATSQTYKYIDFVLKKAFGKAAYLTQLGGSQWDIVIDVALLKQRGGSISYTGGNFIHIWVKSAKGEIIVMSHFSKYIEATELKHLIEF